MIARGKTGVPTNWTDQPPAMWDVVSAGATPRAGSSVSRHAGSSVRAGRGGV